MHSFTRPFRRVLALTLLAALSAAAGGCRSAASLPRELQVGVLSSGWFDAGIENRRNKLIPSFTFTLRNTGSRNLVMLQVNAVFRRVTDTEGELGRAFVTAAGSSGLAPGATTSPLTLRSDFGYLGEEPRREILQNTQFVDAKVELFAKYGPGAWASLGEYKISRELILP
jgi:hypothetical protein